MASPIDGLGTACREHDSGRYNLGESRGTAEPMMPTGSLTYHLDPESRLDTHDHYDLQPCGRPIEPSPNSSVISW